MNEDERYRQAKEHVMALKSFYIHLLLYLVVNLGLFFLNLILHQNWYLWVVFGWGVGLLSHALSLFAHNFLFSREWEEKQIRKHMDRNPGE